MMLIPFVIGALGMITKGLVQELEDSELRDSEDNQNYRIDEFDQNTKSLGDLRRIAVI